VKVSNAAPQSMAAGRVHDMQAGRRCTRIAGSRPGCRGKDDKQISTSPLPARLHALIVSPNTTATLTPAVEEA
jgi:hypothetical protein